MSETIREAVGIFNDRASFEAAVHHLKDAGFGHADLSVLDSHESIDAAGKPATPWREALGAMVGEIKYEGPLVGSVAVLLAGGPTAALIASVIGAATAGVAAKEVLDEVTASPHTEAFAYALEAGGVILWVWCADEAREQAAVDIMQQFGGQNVHVSERTPRTVD